VSSGLLCVNRNSNNLHAAFAISSTITTCHRTFVPRRFADISHSSSVYWIIVISSAMRR